VLQLAKFDRAAGAQLQQLEQLRVRERCLLAGPLHFDELAAASYHDVHIDFSGNVLTIIEIEDRPAVDDSGANGGNAIS
jgi:hypothetical protein